MFSIDIPIYEIAEAAEHCIHHDQKVRILTDKDAHGRDITNDGETIEWGK